MSTVLPTLKEWCPSINVPNDGKGKMFEVMKAMMVKKMTHTDASPAEVPGLPGLYLGSIGAAYNEETLHRLGITHILTAACNIKPKFSDQCKYLLLDLKDVPGDDISRYLLDSIHFIDEAISSSTGRVLVHCFAGKSRSSAIVCAYLMVRRSMSFSSAVDLLRSVRPIVQPNVGFAAQLRAFERGISHYTQAATAAASVAVQNNPDGIVSSAGVEVEAGGKGGEGDGDDNTAPTDATPATSRPALNRHRIHDITITIEQSNKSEEVQPLQNRYGSVGSSTGSSGRGSRAMKECEPPLCAPPSPSSAVTVPSPVASAKPSVPTAAVMNHSDTGTGEEILPTLHRTSPCMERQNKRRREVD